MNEMVERVGEALRTECREIFGSDWSYDNAWRFARVAIETMREPTEAMCRAADALDSVSKGVLVTPIPARAWEAMIDEALK